MDLTPKQQTSEAIRQAETILILTGQHPSIDQAAAVVALAAILRKFGKNVNAIISDNPPAAVSMLDTNSYERSLGGARDFVLKVDVAKAEVDKLRYEVADGKLNIYLTPFKGSFAPSDVTFGYGAFHFDLAIVLGVPTRARIDRMYEQNLNSFDSIPMINLDFHRSNENYGAVNLIEPNASSLCEMLVALSESLQGGIIDAEIATALLMGIVGSTDRFTAAHTSPKSLTVAAQMMAAGARQQAVMRALYRDNKGNERSGDGRNNDRGGDGRNNDKNGDGRSGGGRQQSQGNGQAQPRSDRSAPRQADEPARQEAPRPEQPRNDQPRSEQQRADQPRNDQPRVEQPRAEAPRPEPTRPEPVRSQPAAMEPAISEPAPVDQAEPIIQPGHIEMMTAEPTPPSAPIQPAPETISEPGSLTAAAMAQSPSAPIPQPAPQQPLPQFAASNLPAADFAAAAEMFNRQPPADPIEGDRSNA